LTNGEVVEVYQDGGQIRIPTDQYSKLVRLEIEPGQRISIALLRCGLILGMSKEMIMRRIDEIGRSEFIPTEYKDMFRFMYEDFAKYADVRFIYGKIMYFDSISHT